MRETEDIITTQADQPTAEFKSDEAQECIEAYKPDESDEAVDASIAVDEHLPDDKKGEAPIKWRYCVVGNIVKTHVDENGILRYGSKPFNGGKKVYLYGKYHREFGNTEVAVLGMNRYKRYAFESVPPELIENVRFSRVYKPSILNIMGEHEFLDGWWDNSPEDKMNALEFVNWWNENIKPKGGKNMDIVSKAIRYATDAFEGERRKGDNSPTILHSLEAAAIVKSLGGDDGVISAAVLHDVVEDTDHTIEDIKSEFGDRIAKLVEAETEKKRPDMPASETWRIRKEEAIAHFSSTDDLGVKMICLGDKLANMRSFYDLKKAHGADMWNAFNNKNPEDHHWYYRSIANLMPELSDTLAFKEYDRLVAIVFDED